MPDVAEPTALEKLLRREVHDLRNRLDAAQARLALAEAREDILRGALGAIAWGQFVSPHGHALEVLERLKALE